MLQFVFMNMQSDDSIEAHIRLSPDSGDKFSLYSPTFQPEIRRFLTGLSHSLNGIIFSTKNNAGQKFFKITCHVLFKKTLRRSQDSVSKISYLLVWGGYTSILSSVFSSYGQIQTNEKFKHSSKVCKMTSLNRSSNAKLHSRFTISMTELHSHFIKRHFGVTDCVFAFHFILDVCILN